MGNSDELDLALKKGWVDITYEPKDGNAKRIWTSTRCKSNIPTNEHARLDNQSDNEDPVRMWVQKEKLIEKPTGKEGNSPMPGWRSGLRDRIIEWKSLE